LSKPIVAIVGRPNVGKSTLFNKLIGQRLSIVDDRPGVTRDRIYGQCEWLDQTFSLVDTGGIEPACKDVILSQMREQAQLAIDAADVIVMVTDLRTGVVATDADVASMLKKSGRPVLLCVNKCDHVGDLPAEFYEFYNLGLGDPIAVSSVHGHGTGDLLDAILEKLPEDSEEEEESEFIKVAVIGKPNVGKSSLVNQISGQQRCIVSDIAGTTRDAIDTTVKNKHGTFTFIDTAGLRRQSKVNKMADDIERYSIIRSQMAVERADVCVIMIDALEGFTEQDSKVAGMAHEAGKGCVIVVNKWDAIEKDDKTMQEYKKKLEEDFSFMSYCPILFISAKTGQRIDRLFETIKQVANANAMRITTGTLNDILAQAVARVQPPTDKGKRLKIYYMTQASTKPPTFICFVNTAELFHFSYQRYLENRIRDTFGLEGTPIRFIVRERGDKEK
jgi:GTP-binding protein